ncbi:ribokinase [Cohnella abietis]|uniref:Ribokinase n=1 Tax=Cohnella abietis TaxID=2507935 RepID=A0A3T1DCC3_9BACL|nr:ribokinase [Cohnella abietis]BBI35752.1 ribokinase [Cohnella abietis]
MGNVVVVGSINMDIINRVERHPEPGETIHCLDTSYSPGGKGANQAVSSSLAGSSVTMIGAVGNDAFGEVLIKALHNYGVNSSAISIEEGTSGLAFITVDEAGENTIVLSHGANGKVHSDQLSINMLKGAYAVLLQNEIPASVNEAVMRMCREEGVLVYYNPAPAHQLNEYLYDLIDTIILNETEAALISGLQVTDVASAELSAAHFINKGIKNVIITLGSKGALFKSKDSREFVPAFSVKAVDTTAAGDTFIGAFAASQASGGSVKESLVFAAAASAITVTRVGAQQSIPRKEEIEQLLNSSKL